MRERPTALSVSPALDPCVHCGFCLPACPTYLATGDEADSPRGRIVLMRALAQGELAPHDPAVTEHLEHCLGCRGCEPACPSGVEYGRGLEATRAWLAERNGIPPLARIVLRVFRHRWLWVPLLTAARWARDLGLARAFSGKGRIGFGFASLAASRGLSSTSRDAPSSRTPTRPPVQLFTGCVMSTLFDHVNDATARVLAANGHTIVPARGQRCCGALHAHAGDLDGARRLAEGNVRAFAGSDAIIVVNSAGCGALLKDYGHLLGTADAERFAARVRDVTEVLADDGPRAGAPIEWKVAYDAPCHLQHAQHVHQQVLTMFAAIPGLDVTLAPGSDRCCGSAGIYSLLEPGMSRAVLDAKVEELRTAAPDLVATGNPGCLMQVGAGLAVAGVPARAVHPVELLDASYQAAGAYR
ncbi:MAG TPA: heterodisulfide reductase-related iron-sulfur binding cluster [Gemmatimonadales bacterium]|nr:heterodisulfide reductase-related iron-sulfur binding cluster [Gemmatimonadales bacterium]